MEVNSGILSLIHKTTTAVLTFVKNFKEHRNEILTATSISFSTLMVSPLFYWPTTVIPMLQESDLNIPISPNEIPWIVQAFMLSTLLGPVVIRFLVDRIGRKLLLLLCVIPVIINWALIGNATTFAEICIARCIAGVAYGTVMHTFPVYVEEIFSEAVIPISEGMCFCFGQLGMFFTLSVGSNIEFRTLAWISIIFPTIFFMVFMAAKETPVYLLSKKKVEKAKDTLAWLRQKKDISEDFTDLQNAAESSNKDQRSFKKMFSNMNRNLILFILFANVSFTGMFVTITFLQIIINAIAPDTPSSTIGFFLGFMHIVPKVVSNFLVKKIAHRPLLLIASGITSLSLFVVSNCLTFFSYGFRDGPYTMAVVALFVAISAHSFGIEKVSHEIIGAIFNKFEGRFFDIVFQIGHTGIQVLLVFVFHSFFNEEKQHVPFWIFTGCGFVCWLLIYVYVPETKGLSLEDAHGAIAEMGIKRCYRKICLKDSNEDVENEAKQSENQPVA